MEKKKKQTRKPYEERTDLEKIQSQWKKLNGLHSRRDWSAAVVRAATATELALNFAIRLEFAKRSELDAAFIDGLLKWANGLTGKLDKLLLPLLKGGNNHKTVNNLCELARKINNKRNDLRTVARFATSSRQQNWLGTARISYRKSSNSMSRTLF